MSKRRRQKNARREAERRQETWPEQHPYGRRIVQGLRELIRFNTRAAAAIFGGFSLAQAIIPWTTAWLDKAPFALFGIGMLSLAGWRRLWS